MARHAQKVNLEGQRKVAPPPKQDFFILDERATDLVIDGKNVHITDEMREDGVRMSADEAAFYVASGTIGTAKPSKSKASAQQEAVNRGEIPDMSKSAKPSKKDD